MRNAGLLLSIALIASGCGMPFHYGNYGGGPQTAPERELRFDSPRLSSDGKTILFAFRYKHYPWMLAVASSDPADTKVRVLKFPPMDNWLQPNFGPDPEHFTVVSFCTHEQCYESAKGYNVWLVTAQSKDNLKRISPEDPDIRRANPVFGATLDDLYWFVSDNRVYPDVHLDVSDRYLAHLVDGKETVVFPQTPSNGDWKSKRGRKDPGDLTIIAAYGAGRYDDEGYYFTGMTAGGSSSAAKAAADKPGKFHYALYRYAKGQFELVEPVEVDYVDAPRGGHGYVAMAHHFIKEHSNAVADFRGMQDGHMLWSFRFHGPAYGSSASADLKAVVFDGERGFVDNHVWHPRLQDSVFLWREGMTEAVDLGLPERVKATVEAEIAAEKAAHTPPQPTAPNPGPSP